MTSPNEEGRLPGRIAPGTADGQQIDTQQGSGTPGKKKSTSTTCPAPSVVGSTEREQIKRLATAAAVAVPGDCEHCGGSGRSRATSEQIVHCFGPAMFGENWSIARLHAAIDSATRIQWVNDPAGHDLVITVDGKDCRLKVARPEAAA